MADMGLSFEATCPICDTRRAFSAPDDFSSCRDQLAADGCPMTWCVTRERAMAATLFSMVSRQDVHAMSIHEAAPAPRGLSKWLGLNVPGYIGSGYFPDLPFGTVNDGLRNEDLEHQTFGNEVFDVVIHMDVLEHVFDPMLALREIHRTLKPGGFCLFTVPTERQRGECLQVAFLRPDGVELVGEPEYHGNPQRPEEGVLVTWRYGYELPLLIQRNTDFDVEVRRFQSKAIAAMGPMNEVYVLYRG